MREGVRPRGVQEVVVSEVGVVVVVEWSLEGEVRGAVCIDFVGKA